MIIKKILLDLRTYFSIHWKNKKRFPECVLESAIPKNIKIDSGTVIKKNCIISNEIKSIGKHVYIGDGAKIFNCSHIDNYSCISHDVKIGLDNHKLDGLSINPKFNQMEKSSPTIIGADVLISANAVVMSGIKLGNGCVVGANSFVNKDVPPYAIFAGSPAKLIRYRFDDKEIQKKLISKWWERDICEVKDLVLKKPKIENLVFELKNRNHGKKPS